MKTKTALLAHSILHDLPVQPPNGLRYPLVGGTRQRHFNGTNFKLRKAPENAQTPTTMAPAFFAGDRVHAVLATVLVEIGSFRLQ